MAAFGAWVGANAVAHAITGHVPRAGLMSGVAIVALCANAFVAWLLFRHRNANANAMSVWLCTRNDVIANLAVVGAGLGVWASVSHWPDVAVGLVIALLGVTSAMKIIRRARAELSPLPLAAE